MDLYPGYRLLLVLLILALNAFLAASEVSLLSVRQSRLRQMADAGNRGAQIALGLMANPEQMLSTVQLGTTLTSLGLGWAGEEALHEYIFGLIRPWIGPQTESALGAAAAAVAFLLITYMHVVIGEVVPKNLGIEKADRLAVLVAPALLVFSRVAGPFVTVLERSAEVVSRWLGVKGAGTAASHSPEEIKFIVSASRKYGHLGSFEEEAVLRLLELHELNAREIMTPRSAMAGAPVESSLDDLLRAFHENKYSRIPIYEGSMDRVVGIVYAKDVLDVWHQRRAARDRRRPVPQFDIRHILRQPVVVPETKPLTQLVDTFRHSRSHLALVVDEFGTVAGLLTLEDVLEQIFGEIEDEHDVRLPPLPVVWDSLEIEGATPIRDLETHYQIDVPTDAGFETLAGFLLFRLGRIPGEGDSVDEGDLRFTVIEMDRNRIARVKVEKRESVSA
ncbi:MAG: hemolysin family protein [Bryobacteraceae bacterium]